MKIDLNCDMGESFGRYELGADDKILKFVTSANVACGFHAGDPLVMQQTVQKAVKAGAAIGAHPGYPDLQGFGRRNMDMNPDELEAVLLYQIGALSGFVESAGTSLVHVKPHGALYNHAAKNRDAAKAVASAVKRFSRDLVLVGLAGSFLIEAGEEIGLQTANEGFPERAYEPDGSLRSRKLPGAVIHDPAEAAKQALKLVRDGITVEIENANGVYKVDTLCIHGDSPNALAVVEAVRNALLEADIKIHSL